MRFTAWKPLKNSGLDCFRSATITRGNSEQRRDESDLAAARKLLQCLDLRPAVPTFLARGGRVLPLCDELLQLLVQPPAELHVGQKTYADRHIPVCPGKRSRRGGVVAFHRDPLCLVIRKTTAIGFEFNVQRMFPAAKDVPGAESILSSFRQSPIIRIPIVGRWTSEVVAPGRTVCTVSSYIYHGAIFRTAMLPQAGARCLAASCGTTSRRHRRYRSWNDAFR
jgi:hypothetical protein